MAATNKLPPLSDVQKVLLFIEDGPAFRDACEHKCEEYMFTVSHLERRADVYLYQYASGGQGLCIRHSDDPGNYSSGPADMWVRGIHQLEGVERNALLALLATNFVQLVPREKANI